MAIIRLTKQFDFEAGHALEGYEGKCRDIHGHSYHLDVTVAGNVNHLSGKLEDSMVIDFKDLKSIVKTEIIDRFDHQLILHKESRFISLKDDNPRMMIVDYVPTCENILLDIVTRLNKCIPDNITLEYVFLRETPRSYAEWHREDNMV
ncbi:MAG: 6-carboxytetrahydropterin synthase [Saprospiraceae bacterium]